MKRKLKELILNEPPVIYESFQIQTEEYEYGTGLHIVVDTDYINREVIEMAIDKFIALGEKNWRSEQPVSRNKLPTERYLDVLSRIDTYYTRRKQRISPE